MKRDTDAPALTFKFIVDDGHFESNQQQLTGAQLRTIAHIDPSLQLFEEVHGQGSDLQIDDQTVVTLKEHGETHFYTMPRANMG
ncbi:MAG TPA: multiubiquitin domain-containing protein [Gemmatimonadales bacterium]|nr:multiubiquitin domain-containing protein [Gemmatimonadales bacterium]